MRRIPRWLFFTAAVVVLVLVSLSSLALGSVRRSFPELEGHLSLPGLVKGVEVLRDSFGVPQIYADNPEDLFEAEGYVHAQDRFFEMDVRRHITAGRLSEMFGPSQFATDAYIRTMGWRRVAEQELLQLSPSTRRYLDAYASGVNAYIHGRNTDDLSLEYNLLEIQGLNYTPEDWTAADSVSWLTAMAWDLDSNLAQETEQALMTEKVGASRAASLFPHYPLDGFDPIVTTGNVVKGVFDPAASRSGARPAPAALSPSASPSAARASQLGPSQLRKAASALTAAAKVNAAIPTLIGSRQLGPETGSNSWAVSGRRTASGKAILSNDPHLETSIPSIFAQVGLHCRSLSPACPFDVSGFSFSGVPGVIIGKNTSIAWGFTTSFPDVEDLYLEQVRGNTVRVGNAFVPLQTRTEEIRVQGEDEPRKITIRASRHGPLLSDVDSQLQRVGQRTTDPTLPGYAVALKWTALTPNHSMDALFAINRATNFAQFRAAARLLDSPSQNMVYADTAGNIGYQLPGKIPVRGKGDGRLPSPGWDRSYDWKGTIKFDELPWVYNPPSGYIVAANQPIIGSQYPNYLSADFSYGWRSQEIIDALKDAPPLTLDSAEQLFYNDTIRFAGDIVPTLLRIKVKDPWVVEGQQTLVGWDYSAPPDSAAAAYFNVVIHNVLKLTFRDEMPQDLWPTGGDRWYAVLSDLMKQPNSPWWDDVTTKDRIERRDDILLAAMTNARKEITSLMARDPAQWQWGKVHRVILRNQTLGSSGIGVVERIFNRGNYQVGGGPAVVNALAYDTTEGYLVNNGPAMRMLVDLGDLDSSRWVNESGASGHAYHPNYDDQTPLWATNRTWPFVTTRSAVEARTTNRLELVPSG